jgi:hypothetical protein
MRGDGARRRCEGRVSGLVGSRSIGVALALAFAARAFAARALAARSARRSGPLPGGVST